MAERRIYDLNLNEGWLRKEQWLDERRFGRLLETG